MAEIQEALGAQVQPKRSLFTPKRPLTIVASESLSGTQDHSVAVKRSHGMEPNFVPWQADRITSLG